MTEDRSAILKLWFDVEERYNTTSADNNDKKNGLWFDVEERYNTTSWREIARTYCCGLM